MQNRVGELMKLTKVELIELAEEYDLESEGTKNELVSKIVNFEAGVPAEEPEVVQEPVPAEEQAPVSPGTVEKTTLVRFVGKNLTYGIRGKTYTPKNPFQVVSKSDADYLIVNKPKHFRFATEQEVQDYYS